MFEVTVRHATPDDVSGIQRVARLGWTAAYGEFLSNDVIDRVMDEWYAPEIIRQAITDEAVAYFVARTSDETGNDDLIGYASGGISETGDGCGRVQTLYVHPDRWGDKIGTRLFESVLDSLHEQGTERVEIHVLAANTVGISFYESHGFERVREIKSEFCGTTQREYVYASDL